MDDNPEPNDPRQFLLEMRRRALSRKGLRVQQDENVSLEHLIRTTRALVATTEEIWGRCEPHCCGRVEEDEDGKGNFLFVRVAASTVKASTSMEHMNTIILRTALEVTKQDFFLPVAFPAELCRLAPTPRVSKKEVVPNLRLVLRRSMLLSEDVMVVFLMEYKCYLEQLQVALGVVDAWVLEATKSELFLHSNFGASIHHGKFLQTFNNRLLQIGPIQDVLCSRCHKKLSKHAVQRCWARCSDGANLPNDQMPPAYFPLTVDTNLLISPKFRGRVDIQFFIDDPSERKRLVKFLAFVSNAERDAEHDVDHEETSSTNNNTQP